MNQYSRWALAGGVQGETVALMMGNRPEYFAIWLGLIQVGAIAALISPDLRAPAVAHALKVAGARRVIAQAECAEVCRSAVAELDDAVEIWVHGGGQCEARSELILRLQARAASRCAKTSDDRSRSPIARCGFSPPERPVCRRPLKSVIAGSSSGAIGLPALPA